MSLSNVPRKKSKLQILLLLLFVVQLLLPVRAVRADIGPKPSMEFEFQQQSTGELVTIFAGTLYECEQSDCSDAAPLEEVGPQRFFCSIDRCDATAYGFAPYHLLEVEFTDGKTRRSNVFETAGFDSSYAVTIREEDLLVEPQSITRLPLWSTAVLLLCACLLCGAVLLIALAVFFFWRSSRK